MINSGDLIRIIKIPKTHAEPFRDRFKVGETYVVSDIELEDLVGRGIEHVVNLIDPNSMIGGWLPIDHVELVFKV